MAEATKRHILRAYEMLAFKGDGPRASVAPGICNYLVFSKAVKILVDDKLRFVRPAAVGELLLEDNGGIAVMGIAAKSAALIFA